ncbi:MAG: HupE/UreJ family protein [Armatimonadetes bacterium]|nr:HupE/UreJ family protein [Armatimonadota bacterium]
MSDFGTFFTIGLHHILEGYDHLLFLLGLILVARSWRSLLMVVSAFTVAHSTTLVLSALEVVAIPSIITETLIAASIVYVGIENTVRSGEHSQRWVVAGLFGLIHGAGFSGHLVGLLKGVMEQGSIWPALIGFNIGIEVGQVVVVLAALPLIWLAEKQSLREKLVPEISRMIAGIGGVLVVARIWGIG